MTGPILVELCTVTPRARVAREATRRRPQIRRRRSLSAVSRRNVQALVADRSLSRHSVVTAPSRPRRPGTGARSTWRSALRTDGEPRPPSAWFDQTSTMQRRSRAASSCRRRQRTGGPVLRVGRGTCGICGSHTYGRFERLTGHGWSRLTDLLSHGCELLLSILVGARVSFGSSRYQRVRSG